MIKGGTRRRVNLDDPENGPTVAKRPMMNGLAKRAQELRSEQFNAAKIILSGGIGGNKSKWNAVEDKREMFWREV